jgi:hypothetical protein
MELHRQNADPARAHGSIQHGARRLAAEGRVRAGVASRQHQPLWIGLTWTFPLATAERDAARRGAGGAV